jgi:hypothetical protein
VIFVNVSDNNCGGIMKTYEYVRSIADYYAYWDFVEVNEIGICEWCSND